MSRDDRRALELLISAADTSRNQTTAAARDAFLSLPHTTQKVLLANVWVFDGAPSLVDVRDEIETILHYSAPHDQVPQLTDELEGWWFDRVSRALTKTTPTTIFLTSIQSKVSELREKFKLGHLPLDHAIDAMPPVTALPPDDRTFIRQMKLVHVSLDEARATVHDYYRAYRQRSRWAREHLLLDGEVEGYDRNLCDAWHRSFLAHTADIAEEASDATREAQGRIVFRWARQHQKPLRNRDELWLSSGSFQMLADQLRVGWHPNYHMLLAPTEGDT